MFPNLITGAFIHTVTCDVHTYGQADGVLGLTLRRLTALERGDLEGEAKTLEGRSVEGGPGGGARAIGERQGYSNRCLRSICGHPGLTSPAFRN